MLRTRWYRRGENHLENVKSVARAHISPYIILFSFHYINESWWAQRYKVIDDKYTRCNGQCSNKMHSHWFVYVRIDSQQYMHRGTIHASMRCDVLFACARSLFFFIYFFFISFCFDFSFLLFILFCWGCCTHSSRKSTLTSACLR